MRISAPRKTISILLQSLLVFLLFLAGVAGRSETLPLLPYSPVVPGLDYLNFRLTNHPWSIHLARLDRSYTNLEVLSALTRGTVLGLSTVAAQAKSFPPQLGKPLVAINGDFFVLARGPYQGDPLGLEILNGELLTAPGGATFWIEPGEKFCLGTVTPRFRVSSPHGEKLRFGLNRERNITNNLVLYTPSFGSSTRTTNGMELVLEQAEGKDWLPLRVDKTYSARVRQVSGANTPLAPGIAVLSIGPKLQPKFAGIRPGALLTFSTDTSADVSRAQTAIGGRPVVLAHGREGQWPLTGTNTLPRHPRTAIGWNQKYFYFVVVDGRQKDLSMGMDYVEIAHFFKQLGCTDAINLDGGGSTTFWLDGKIMNSPSDKHERAVANCLFIAEHPSSTASAGASAHPPN